MPYMCGPNGTWEELERCDSTRDMICTTCGPKPMSGEPSATCLSRGTVREFSTMEMMVGCEL